MVRGEDKRWAPFGMGRRWGISQRVPCHILILFFHEPRVRHLNPWETKAKRLPYSIRTSRNTMSWKITVFDFS